MRHNVCPLIFGAARSTGSRSAPCSRGRRTAFWVSKAKHSSPDIAKAFKGLLPRRLFTFFHAISIPCKADKCVRDFGHQVFPNKSKARFSSPDIAKASNGLLPRRLLTFFHAISIPRRTDTCVRYITHVAKIIGNDCPNDIAEEQVHHLWFHK